jgi:hypothetical protein
MTTMTDPGCHGLLLLNVALLSFILGWLFAMIVDFFRRFYS